MPEPLHPNDRRTVILLTGSRKHPSLVSVMLKVPERTSTSVVLDVPDIALWGSYAGGTTDLLAAGAAVFAGLCAEPEVAERLAQLVADTSLAPHRLELQTAGVDPRLLFEAICAPGAVEPMARDERFEVLRSVRVLRPIDDAIAIDGPVRWTGVLAPSGAEGSESHIEAELRAALEPLVQIGLPIAVTVLVATHALKAKAADVLAGLGLPSGEVELLGATDAAVKVQVKGRPGERPNIVHFYCHGDLGDGDGAPALLVANKTSALAGTAVPRPADTTVQPANLFSGDYRNPDLLLVVVNACDSGTTPPRTDGAPVVGSLAETLVRDGLAPFVIAHNQPLSPNESHAATRATYLRLGLALLDEDGTAERTFLPRLIDGRKALSEDRWVVPALWARDAPTGVDGRRSAALRVKLRALEAVEAAMEPTAPAGQREAIRAEVNAARTAVDALDQADAVLRRRGSGSMTASAHRASQPGSLLAEGRVREAVDEPRATAGDHAAIENLLAQYAAHGRAGIRKLRTYVRRASTARSLDQVEAPPTDRREERRAADAALAEEIIASERKPEQQADAEAAEPATSRKDVQHP
ncbi:hypothetical protein ACE2AJ_00565 [Aquihabitans daechungensis]|uniref:hypothetical protein n=1 Tax=Aquihabitans daechungensis TaxID=1052257 RepID=UPI003B9FD6F6